MTQEIVTSHIKERLAFLRPSASLVSYELRGLDPAGGEAWFSVEFHVTVQVRIDKWGGLFGPEYEDRLLCEWIYIQTASVYALAGDAPAEAALGR